MIGPGAGLGVQRDAGWGGACLGRGQEFRLMYNQLNV